MPVFRNRIQEAGLFAFGYLVYNIEQEMLKNH